MLIFDLPGMFIVLLLGNLTLFGTTMSCKHLRAFLPDHKFDIPSVLREVGTTRADVHFEHTFEDKHIFFQFSRHLYGWRTVRT